MIIVWGSANLARQNVTRVRARCEHCGRPGVLVNYDTTRYGTLYFIPLIPMGSKHIIDECGACKHGWQMSLANWEKLVAEELNPAITDYLNAPSSPELAAKAISAVVMLADARRLDTIAPAIDGNLDEDAMVQAQLGQAFATLLRDEQAEPRLQRAIELTDDIDIKTMVAVYLLDRGRPAEATELVEASLATGDEQRMPLGLLLAESFIEVGEPESAQATLDGLLELFPQAANDDAFKHYQKVLKSPKMQHQMQRQMQQQAQAGARSLASVQATQSTTKPSARLSIRGNRSTPHSTTCCCLR